ncbi:DC-STAMP domain-containing protein 2 [Lampris incognitus]|uniref:DC-STAMP domain-containing protein 2 n=1 Tax=Lampris incognitus TaxID=2546036 RepID=UPI0024B49EAD|nr:DC-STAMP domain-containing protein 2 [Lampris incognitus]
MDHFRRWRVGRRKVRGHLLEALRSLGAFCLGLLLASSYGVTAFFLQKHELWFCVYSTLAIATLAAFGMGLSASVRTTAMLMFPTLCSEKGRRLVLFLVLSVLLAGPLTNTMENFERAADSVLCGAELARNHTQELMRRAATPLLPVLDSIREMTSNAYALAGRVHNLINALTENVRHVARTLRNVIHFLVDIGDVCNAKLGTPHRKCTAVFDEAREDCTELLGIFNFLCDIVEGFRPLCGLARVVQLFCVIPSYIASHLRKRLAAPTVAAFERMKQEFEFNISASMTFDLDVNSSRSLQQASQEIMEEVSSELGRFQALRTPLAWGSLLLLAVSFLQALRYRRRYLSQDDFDNIYLSEEFVNLDQRRAAEHQDTVLPLTRRETSTYISPLSPTLTPGERRTAALSAITVLRHMTLGGLLVAQDLLVFWMLELVYQQVQGGLIARAPVIVEVQVNGSGYASDILKDVVSSFNILQSGNITILSKKCLLEPSEPNYTGYVIIGFLYGLALLLALIGGYIQRCRRLICATYYPRREQERIQFLHNHILSQRRCLGTALQMSVTRSQADGGGAGGRGWLLTLLQWVPGGSYLSDLLGMSAVTCGICGETREERHQLPCLDPQCKADVPEPADNQNQGHETRCEVAFRHKLTPMTMRTLFPPT